MKLTLKGGYCANEMETTLAALSGNFQAQLAAALAPADFHTRASIDALMDQERKCVTIHADGSITLAICSGMPRAKNLPAAAILEPKLPRIEERLRREEAAARERVKKANNQKLEKLRQAKAAARKRKKRRKR